MKKFEIPKRVNEPIKGYLKGSSERKEIHETYHSMYNESVDIPLYIGNNKILTKKRQHISPPHDIKKIVGTYSVSDSSHVEQAIEYCLKTKKRWTNTPWKERESIFLKAAELISGPYRSKINAATMIGQSKNIFQAEIDAACELIDFLKLNIIYMSRFTMINP